MKKVTSNEVARLAGVSQSTVSRAFNRQDVVSQETLERIHAVALEIGYRPNELARSLISRKSNIIGIVMGDILNPFYPAVLNAFTNSLQRLGRRVLLFSVPPGHDVDEVLPQLMQYQVAGVVITSATLSSRMAEAFGRGGTPVVLFNRTVYGGAVNSVCCANEEAGRLVARTLLKAGHRRFGLIGGLASTSTHIERRGAFAEELRRHGIEDLADFDLPQQIAEQTAIKRKHRGPPLRQWRVALIHELGDVTKEQACRKRRRDFRRDFNETNFALDNLFKQRTQRRQIIDILQAFTRRFDQNGEVRVFASDLQQLPGAKALLPQRGALTRIAAREKQRARRTFAEPRGEERRSSDRVRDNPLDRLRIKGE